MHNETLWVPEKASLHVRGVDPFPRKSQDIHSDIPMRPLLGVSTQKAQLRRYLTHAFLKTTEYLIKY